MHKIRQARALHLITTALCPLAATLWPTHTKTTTNREVRLRNIKSSHSVERKRSSHCRNKLATTDPHSGLERDAQKSSASCARSAPATNVDKRERDAIQAMPTLVDLTRSTVPFPEVPLHADSRRRNETKGDHQQPSSIDFFDSSDLVRSGAGRTHWPSSWRRLHGTLK